jgi:2-polyprenyl-6-methoxyphenol hydroxylase-like FAD-dependent oxidoreductase
MDSSLCHRSVQKLLSFVKSTLKWRLMDRKPLSTWVHPKGRVVLLGDACHPMLVCSLLTNRNPANVR